MDIRVFDDKHQLGLAAASDAASAILDAVAARGRARIVAATGASQFEFLDALTAMPGLPWNRVELFHLDEYIGLAENHRASFRRYLRERLIDKVGLGSVHLLNVDTSPEAACRAVGLRLAVSPVDVAFVGIGENGHLAFNDPPADFSIEAPYIIVDLDEACRRQQVSEGWFERVEQVPARAVSMSIQQILKARRILCMVPDRRKAEAVRAAVEGPVTPAVPASVLQTHAAAVLFLDRASASKLSPETLYPTGDRRS